MKSDFSTLELLILNTMVVYGMFMQYLKGVFQVFHTDELTTDEIPTILMNRTLVEPAGARGTLIYNDVEINTLETHHQTRLLPDGAYAIYGDDASGVYYVENKMHKFYFTTARHQPKDREIVLGSTYKTVALRKEKLPLTQLHGGTPALQKFMNLFEGDVVPQALLIVTTKGETLGTE